MDVQAERLAPSLAEQIDETLAFSGEASQRADDVLAQVAASRDAEEARAAALRDLIAEKRRERDRERAVRHYEQKRILASTRSYGSRTISRRRDSHGTRPGHRRCVRRATTARDDPGDSDGPGDAGPHRRAVVACLLRGVVV